MRSVANPKRRTVMQATAPVAFLLALLLHGTCRAFTSVNTRQSRHRIQSVRQQGLFVAVDPMHDAAKTSSFKRIKGYNAPTHTSKKRPFTPNHPRSANQYYRQKNNKSRYPQRRRPRRDRLDDRSAEWIEQRFITAFDNFRFAISSQMKQQQQQDDKENVVISFPTVRECNEALAFFGDTGDLLRSLRMFGRMRKLQYLRDNVLVGRYQNKPTISFRSLPVPSLVTYSTLMSRAVKLNKPRVALRLWNLMMTTTTMPKQQQQYSSDGNDIDDEPAMAEDSVTTIVPDVKAANILMNCYAKLADVKRAKQLLHEMKTGKSPLGCDPILRQNPQSTTGQSNPSRQPKEHQSTMPDFTITPNAITINTLLNACQNAKDLDSAMEAKAEFDALRIRPDATTYTTLIATVARGPSQWSGQSDPSLAFELLKEMQDQHGIRPNGMTYSALIDVCGRCRRSDLALQGLRIMLRQKNQQQQEREMWVHHRHHQGRAGAHSDTPYTLHNEVGAWTAAIDACGKAGRIETATKLFYAMSSNFGCEPNTVTCGCITDSLLRAGRTAETLQVLRYMKTKGLEPTEVMYTSLMTRADRLVQMEQSSTNSTSSSTLAQQEDDPMGSDETSGAKAIEVYTELMRSLVDKRPFRGGNKGMSSKSNDQAAATPASAKDDQNSAVLLKVFLVFQQMKVSGATPDTACYNALLRACARAGDYDRAMEVMKELQTGEVLYDSAGPNDTSWRELLRVASNLGRSDLALKVWNEGLSYHKRKEHDDKQNPSSKSESPVVAAKTSPTVNHGRSSQWIPSTASFAELIQAFLKESKTATLENGERKRRVLLESVIENFQRVLRSSADDEDPEANIMSLVDKDQLLDNDRAMLLILQAVVGLHDIYDAESSAFGLTATTTKLMQQRLEMEELALSILNLESLRDIRSKRLDWSSFQALERAESWKSRNDFG